MNFKIPANSSIRPSFPARYIFVDDISTNNGSFRIKAKSESFFVDQKMKVGSKLVALPEVVDQWKFENDSAVEIEIEISAGLVFYDRNDIEGDVNALTRADNLTPDGNQFIGGFSGGGGASDYARVGLYNPVASATVLNLTDFSCSESTGIFEMRYADSVVGWLDWTTLASLQHNKKLGYPNGVGKIMSLATTSVNGNFMTRLSCDLNLTPYIKEFDEKPIQIFPGQVLFVASSLAATIWASYEWNEEAIN